MTHHAAGGPDEPSEPIELDEAAHALLWGLRAIVVGRGDCPALRRAFLDLCGDQGDEALNLLFVVIKQIAFRSRRRLSVHLPGCRAISGDELCFLAAFEAAQAGVGGNRVWLSSLMGVDVDPHLADSVGSLAQILLLHRRLMIVQASAEQPTSRPSLLH